jgi:DNA polymerase III sliding clamp (beta) subunit (PCNA family)
MKATIERATLLKSLGHVQSVVERRNTIPILSNVLIEARDDGSIRLMATDLDLQVDESVPANVSQAGATTISAHTFFDIVRKLPEGSQVELSAAEGKMRSSPAARASISQRFRATISRSSPRASFRPGSSFPRRPFARSSKRPASPSRAKRRAII